MSKHTPGPWIVDGSDISPAYDISLGICAISPVDQGGAKVWHHGVETNANAHLIAAAPELLEKLTNLVGLARLGAARLDKYHAALADAESAIAKARGDA